MGSAPIETPIGAYMEQGLGSLYARPTNEFDDGDLAGTVSFTDLGYEAADMHVRLLKACLNVRLSRSWALRG